MKSGVNVKLLVLFFVFLAAVIGICAYFGGGYAVFKAGVGLAAVFLVMILVGLLNNRTNAKDYGERQMRQMLEKYVPEGETLLAGVHGYGEKVEMYRTVYGSCSWGDDDVCPQKRDGAYHAKVAKYAGYEVYIAMTEQHYIFSACEFGEKYYYEVDDIPLPEGVTPEERESHVDLRETGIGYVFGQEDIESCGISRNKKVTDCEIKLKDGTYFHLQFLNRDIAPEASPHYLEYRDAVLECLKAAYRDA